MGKLKLCPADTDPGVNWTGVVEVLGMLFVVVVAGAVETYLNTSM